MHEIVIINEWIKVKLSMLTNKNICFTFKLYDNNWLTSDLMIASQGPLQISSLIILCSRPTCLLSVIKCYVAIEGRRLLGVWIPGSTPLAREYLHRRRAGNWNCCRSSLASNQSVARKYPFALQLPVQLVMPLFLMHAILHPKALSSQY